jgi:hypothetical protein
MIDRDIMQILFGAETNHKNIIGMLKFLQLSQFHMARTITSLIFIPIGELQIVRSIHTHRLSIGRREFVPHNRCCNRWHLLRCRRRLARFCFIQELITRRRELVNIRCPLDIPS